MQKVIGIFLTVIGLFAVQSAQAQGTLYVSNLGQSPTGSASIGSDSWIAQSFVTGTDSGGYYLNSVQLLMNQASGSPNGFTVSIYNMSGSQPGSSLGSISGVDPAPGGLFSYTASGITLSPSTRYFVVLTAATPVAQDAYIWSAANTTTYNSSWVIDDTYFNSANGSSWAFHLRQEVFQLGLSATAVPEPSSLGLLGLGCLLFGGLTRRRPRGFRYLETP